MITPSLKAAAEPLVIALRPLDAAGLVAETIRRREAVRAAPGAFEEGHKTGLTLSGCLRLPSGVPAAGIAVRAATEQ